jgi:hypothetical protein
VAGTNVIAVKAALLTVLQGAQSSTVSVDYAYSGKTDGTARQYVWLGKATFEQDYAALTSGRKPREEVVVIDVHVTAYKPGGTVQDTDAAVVALALVMENAIANDPQLGGAVTGLRYAGIRGGEMEYAIDDEGVASLITYHVTFKSRLN